MGMDNSTKIGFMRFFVMIGFFGVMKLIQILFEFTFPDVLVFLFGYICGCVNEILWEVQYDEK